MEQVIKEESKKVMALQMRQARLQRQVQVRQQAMAWTEATRRRFQEAKEREIKNLANAVTEEAQSTAIQNIEHLTKLHDLAMAEVGMAHRAAAGFKNAEKLKSLKRLKDEEVAKNRGAAALIKLAKDEEMKARSTVSLLKRKEEVRRLEDRKSKELISSAASRKPLVATNLNTESRPKHGPPEYLPSIAKSLRVVTNDELDPKTKKSAQRASLISAKAKRKSSETIRRVCSSTSSTDMLNQREDAAAAAKVQEGILNKMVRIRTRGPVEELLESSEKSEVKSLYDRLTLRKYYMEPRLPGKTIVAKPENSTVRYFDAAIPKGEVKYIAPKGLAVKEGRSNSDAWEKGRQSSEKLQRDQDTKIKQDEELVQRAAERGKMAMKKARLEKEVTEVKNEMLQGLDIDILGSGSQAALLGLEDNVQSSKSKHQSQQQDDYSSDEFSAVSSDTDREETTLKKVTLRKGLPKVRSGERLHGSDLPVTSDEFSAVESENERKMATKKLKLAELNKILQEKDLRRASEDSFTRGVDTNSDALDKKEKQAEQSVLTAERKKIAKKRTTLEKKAAEATSERLQGLDTEILQPDPRVPLQEPESSDRQNYAKSKPQLRQDGYTSDEFSAIESENERKVPMKKSRQKTRATAVNKKTRQEMELRIAPKVASPTTGVETNFDATEKDRQSSENLVRSYKEKNVKQAEQILSKLEKAERRKIAMKKTAPEKKATEAKSERLQGLDTGIISPDPRVSPTEPENRDQVIVAKSKPQLDEGEYTSDEFSAVESESDKGSMTKRKGNLKKKFTGVKNKTLQGRELEVPGTVSPLAPIGPEDNVIAPSTQNEDEYTSDEFSAVESDEDTESTANRSEMNSITTDYYSPPDGPFTSTPDGKLHPKRSDSRSISSEDPTETMRKRTLYYYLNKFLARRPESIEKLPVSSSSSSIIRADSDLLSSDSLKSFHSVSTPESRSRSENTRSTTMSSSKTGTPSSGEAEVTWKTLPLPTLSEEESEVETSSTIAETAIVAGVGRLLQSEDTSISTSGSGKNDSTTDRSSGTTDDSLTGMLQVLSRHQHAERQQLEHEEANVSQRSLASSAPDETHLTDKQNESSRSLHSSTSSGSFPDASLILRELRSKHKTNGLRTNESSPKSGPEKETERVQLLDDITPVTLWETPNRQNVLNETEQLSEVFEKLVGKWSKLKIEPPPW